MLGLSRQPGLAVWCSFSWQGLGWLLDFGGQGLEQRAGPGFGGLGLAGMRKSKKKTQVHGGSEHCWPALRRRWQQRHREVRHGRSQARETPNQKLLSLGSNLEKGNLCR